MLVVEGIMDSSSFQSEFGTILSNCRLLVEQFPNFKISLGRKQINYVTHILLRVLKSYVGYHIFYLILSYITSMYVPHHISYLISSYITFNLI